MIPGALVGLGMCILVTVAHPAITGVDSVRPGPVLSAEVSRGEAPTEAGGLRRSVEAAGVPAVYSPYFADAARAYGVPLPVLVAVAAVESNFDPRAVGPRNYTGQRALGMMQILPSTWSKYGVRAYGRPGRPDPKDAADSIFTAARVLAAAGVAGNMRGALLRYNHSGVYADRVLRLAARLSGICDSVNGF